MIDKDYVKQIGSKIRKYRKGRRVSLEKLAAKANITFSCLSEIEHGRVDFRISTLKAICEGLEMDVKDLL